MNSVCKYILFFFLSFSTAKAQYSLYRSYVPQNPLPPNYISYLGVDIHAPVRTADKGYMLSFHPWSPNIHWAYPEDFYVIKTDSNLIPKWKVGYFCHSVALPTGGIILYWSFGKFGLNGFEHSFVQKVTADGTTVWTKEILGDTQLSDAVAYGNKVRLIGSKIANISFFPFPNATYQGLSLEIDTMGNITGSNLFNLASSNYFNRITRAANGEFFVSSYGELDLLKLDASFNLLWAKSVPQGGTKVVFNKIVTLANGDILATGSGAFDPNSTYATTPTIFRISAAGQILALKYIPAHSLVSDLCRNAQGKFVGTFSKINNDSLQIFEMDSLLNIQSVKFFKKGKGIGSPARGSNGLVIPFFDNDPKVITTDHSGNTCYTLPGLGPFVTATAALVPNSATSIPAAFTFSNTGGYPISPQGYSDTCKCNNPVTALGSTVCSGATASAQASAFGGVNWYTTPSGGAPFYSGNNYYFIPTTGPQQVFYAAAINCGNTRVPVTVSVSASPQVQAISDKSIMCIGEVASVSVVASSTVAWAPTYSTVTVYTTNATGTGSVYYTATAPNGCSGIGAVKILGDLCTYLHDENATELHVFPNPTNGNIYVAQSQQIKEHFRLYTAEGRLLKYEKLAEHRQIDLHDMPPGIYLLELEGFKPVKIVKIE